MGEILLFDPSHNEKRARCLLLADKLRTGEMDVQDVRDLLEAVEWVPDYRVRTYPYDLDKVSDEDVLGPDVEVAIWSPWQTRPERGQAEEPDFAGGLPAALVYLRGESRRGDGGWPEDVDEWVGGRDA